MKDLPLTCPCPLKSVIDKVDGGYICQNRDCCHREEMYAFKEVNRIPVLISEERCDTICTASSADSYIERPPEKTGWLKTLIRGKSAVTENNCQEFVARLKAASDHPKVLIIGSGARGEAADVLWNDDTVEIHGMDVYASNSVDVVCDAHYLPFESEYYDGVWIQAVLEHVVEPPKVVEEIFRVLKGGGLVYAETPFMQQVHEGAYDFTRYTVLGHRYLFRRFALLAMGGNKGPDTVLAWAIRYLVWSITRSRKIARIFGMVAGLILRPLSYLTSDKSMHDASSGVFFMGTKDADLKLSHKDLVALYKGQF